MSNTDIAYAIEQKAKRIQKLAQEAMKTNGYPDCLDDIDSLADDIRIETDEIEDAEEPINLSTIHNTSIQYNATDYNDIQLMDSINECLFRGINIVQLTNIITELYKTKP